MSEEDLELLVTMDDPGEDTLEEDTFHHHPTDKTDRLNRARRPNDQRTAVTDDSESAG
jgi:hypothetical protein